MTKKVQTFKNGSKMSELFNLIDPLKLLLCI